MVKIVLNSRRTSLDSDQSSNNRPPIVQNNNLVTAVQTLSKNQWKLVATMWSQSKHSPKQIRNTF